MKKALQYFALCFSVFTSLHAYAQSWNPLGSAGFSDSTAIYTSIAIDGSGTPYVVYSDYSTTPFGKATVMKYNGTSWVTVGNAGFSEGDIWWSSIAIDPMGTPYVAFEDWANGGKATVMKFNGTDWVNLGSPDFSDTTAYYTGIAISANDTPYVVYEDGGNSWKATVMKYNGSSWVTVGNAGFSAGEVAGTSIAIDEYNTPYVAYEDFGNSEKITVMKYDGSNWVTVGNAGFSDSIAYTFPKSIAIDRSGTPYVIYEDWGNNRAATVMKDSSNTWVTVGSKGFSGGLTVYTSITIDSTGIPYVAYENYDNGNKVTAMKYNGSTWGTIGSSSLSTGVANEPNIAISPAGTLYVAYSDGSYNSKATVMKYDTSTGMKNILSASVLSIFPNPATTSLSIQSSTQPINQLTIINLLGQTVCTLQPNTQITQVNVAAFPPGVYFIKINGTEVRKFLKE